MPTWYTRPRDMKKTRSPGLRWDFEMCRVLRYWLDEVRGRFLPTRAYDHLTRPEQSKRLGPMAPYRYRAPLRVAATLTTLVRFAVVMAAASAEEAEAISAAPPTERTTARARKTRKKAGRSALW